MDISAHAIFLADRPHRAVRVTSVRTRRITSSIVSWLCAVPSFAPGGRSFVPTCGFRGAPRAGPVKVGRRACLALAPALPGHALAGPSTARGLSRLVRCLIGLDALEGAPLVKNRPGDTGQLVGERNRQHIVVQALLR